MPTRNVELALDSLDEMTAYKKYCTNDIISTKDLFNSISQKPAEAKMIIPSIKNVIFNPPATIVFWNDGTKTVVKCQDNDEFDAEKGLAMAIAKKHFGNKGSYCNQIKKWTETYEDESKTSPDLPKDNVKRLRELGRRLKEEYDRGQIRRAYSTLVAALHKKRPRKDDLAAAMEEAIGYLGEVLDD
jgi:hypothetical protein